MEFAKDAAQGRDGHYAFSAAEEDWIYVDDAVAAVQAVARAETVLASVYNVAGSTVSPHEAAHRLVEHCGSKVKIHASDDARKTVLIDGNALAVATGYTPRVAIDEGVARLARSLRGVEANS